MKASPETAVLASRESERSIIAALFSEGGQDVYDRITLLLDSDDFYFKEYRIVFDAFSALIAKDVRPDLTTLATHIKASDGYDETVRTAIAEAVSMPYAIDNVLAYAESIIEKASARKIRGSLGKLTDKLSLIGGDLTSDQVLSELDAVSLSFDRRNKQNQLLEVPMTALNAVVNRLTKLESGEIVGVMTGIEELDAKLGGMHPGDLVIIAGRPSMGKSALALDIGLKAAARIESAENQELTAIFSLEMGMEKLTVRSLSNIGGVDHDRLRKATLTDTDWDLLSVAFKKYEESNLRIDCDSTLTPAMLRSKLRMLQKQTGQKIKLIIIDYLQLMDVDASARSAQSNRQNDISYISRSLKKIAKEFGAVVVALSQLNRGVEQRADKRPLMSDLRESGALEQDADIILLLYRDEYYNPDSDAKGIAEVIIAKARDGGVGMVPTEFRGEYQRFSSVRCRGYSYEQKYGGER